MGTFIEEVDRLKAALNEERYYSGLLRSEVIQTLIDLSSSLTERAEHYRLYDDARHELMVAVDRIGVIINALEGPNE